MLEFISANMFALGQISLSVATAFIAYLVYRSTRTLGKLEQTRFFIDQVQTINKMFIDDKQAFDVIFNSDKIKENGNDIDDYKHKRRMITMMILQVGNAIYNAKREGYIDNELFDDYINNLINRWMADHKDYMLSILKHWSTDYGRYLADEIRNSMKEA